MRGLDKGPVVWVLRTVVLAALLAAPFYLASFRLGILLEILVFVILAISLDLLVGYTGLPSLGHALYFGVAGYIGVIVARTISTDIVVGLVIGALAATVVAVVTGWLAVRTKGIYFLMLTLAFGQLFWSLTISWSDVTGGANGLVAPPPTFLGYGPLTRPMLYYFALIVAILLYAVLWRLTKAPFGRALVGIRENEPRMQSIGYSTFAYKLAAFVVAGAMAGVAGVIFAQFNRFMAPDNVHFLVSAIVLIMVIVGGSGSLRGPAVGAVIVLLLRDELAVRFHHWEIVLGVILVLIVYFMPRGLAGLMDRIRDLAMTVGIGDEPDVSRTGLGGP